MYKKINCRMNDQDAWCKDKRVKRSLFGLGARCCLEHNDQKCEYKDPVGKPKISPKGTK